MKSAIILPLLVALALPFVAHAAPSTDAPGVRWEQISEQAVKNLKSDYFSIRRQGLKNMIYLARVRPAGTSMDEAVPVLIRLHEQARRPRTRDLALAALESIGSAQAQDYVQRHTSGKQRERTQALIAEVVSRYSTPTDTAAL